MPFAVRWHHSLHPANVAVVSSCAWLPQGLLSSRLGIARSGEGIELRTFAVTRRYMEPRTADIMSTVALDRTGNRTREDDGHSRFD